MNLERSTKLRPRAHELIPGGAHTYAKGDDQFPSTAPGFIARGEGSHVWDVDGNEFIEFGSGLRAVTLGHGYRPVVEAACRALQLGTNFVRPAALEVEAAEKVLGLIGTGEMIKFAKNGSDVTTAALKLARAVTGRDLLGVCAEQPFFSTDDWFIGTTAMNAGIPHAISSMTLKFNFNDLASAKKLFDDYPNKIACLFLEAETVTPPAPGFLQGLLDLCHTNGALLVLDEMITGFRWHNAGAQGLYQFQPDISCFGKAMGNGLSISAMIGKREFMSRGGLCHDKERVFLLSTTHGAETHHLAAAMAVVDAYQSHDVIGHMNRVGSNLSAGVTEVVRELGMQDFFQLAGRKGNLVFATLDDKKQRSQPFRTLFLQEMARQGILTPSFVVSYAHSDADIDRTIECTRRALQVYQRALTDGVEKYIVGPSVKPVLRKFN